MSGKAGRVALAVGTGGFSEVYRGAKKMMDVGAPAGAAGATETPAAQQERLEAYDEGKKRAAANRRLLTGSTGTATAGAGTSLLK